ncbi:Histidine kinase-, DNA gyrase B-, and HSP90-like ATPase [compost metagenome]
MAAVSFEEQKDYRIHLGEEFVQRILDNVISNILKYAEPKEPIYIEMKREGTHLLLYFRNTICPSKSSQGTGLGLVTCRSILENCHGTVKWSKEGDEFKLWLLVPVEG